VSNTGVPDSAAAYWFQPVVAGSTTRIVVSGRYPDARYASLSVYTPAGSMFAYYPRASVCPLATLAARGAAACGHPR